MATATSRRAKPAGKAIAQRIALCKELLEIEKKHTDVFARMKAIETDLKAIANDNNDSFKEDIAGLGSVSVAPAKAAEFKGSLPQIQTEAWLALKAAERKALEKSGLIMIEQVWGSKSYGRVTVKLF